MNKYSYLGVVILIVCADLACAAPLSKSQTTCFNALAAAGNTLAAITSKTPASCVKQKINDKKSVFDVAACLSAETKAVNGAKNNTLAVAKRLCKILPGFGIAHADEINAAFANPVNMGKLFGEPIATTLKPIKTDPKTATCQITMAEQMSALVQTEVAAYKNCTKTLLAKKNAVNSALDLQVCERESVALSKAKMAAIKRIQNQCALVAPSLAASGVCANAATANDLAVCVSAQAHCDAATSLNRAYHRHAAGHLFDHGIAQYYCGTKPTSSQSVARQWNEANLSAIRIDNPRPPVHARNLFHLSVAMFDAWAAYDSKAKPYMTAERLSSKQTQQDREIAISFAAYRILAERYSKQHSLGYADSEIAFSVLMRDLGLDKNYTDTSGDHPAAVGNRIAKTLLTAAMTDGANEAEDYADPSYTPVNSPLIVKEPDFDLSKPFDPNRWQPLALDKIISQNGIVLPGKVQTSIGSQWGNVTPFALSKANPGDLYLDPGPQPQLGGVNDTKFKAEVLDVIDLSSQLSPYDTTMVDISPASQGNNPLAANTGTGYTKNPVTGTPYTPQIVKRGDFGRVLAEWWADGPTSETPPGHWNSIANTVSDSPGFSRQIAGVGPTLERLEWDVKLYFALNGATHDAAIAAWGAKRKYDGARPISMVRYMAKQGQSSDPGKPHYHAHGLPLKAGLVELITTASSAAGQRHEALVKAGASINDIAILAWAGSPANPKTDISGVKWVLGSSWLPYQRATFVTPAFPGYISGHSTFSRASAEILTAITGSEYFPGGLYEYTIPKDTYLIHEVGPSQTVRLQWARYFDAADQSGRSRLWGGIHVEADDFAGRTVGHQAGLAAFTKAMGYF